MGQVEAPVQAPADREAYTIAKLEVDAVDFYPPGKC